MKQVSIDAMSMLSVTHLERLPIKELASVDSGSECHVRLVKCAIWLRGRNVYWHGWRILARIEVRSLRVGRVRFRRVRTSITILGSERREWQKRCNECIVHLAVLLEERVAVRDEESGRLRCQPAHSL